MRRSRRARCGGACLYVWLLLHGLPAWTQSQEPPEASSEPAQEQTLPAYREEVLVRARAPVSPGASVTVIDRDTIEASQARNVAELIELAAGVTLLSNGSRGATSAQIRGGDPNFTLVLLDGVPLNDPTDIEGGAVDLASLQASGIERIEIARGPLSYFYGSSALGGVIHITTRRDAEERASASVDAGTASFLRPMGAVSGSAGRGSYFVSAGWERERDRVASESFEQLQAQGTASAPLGSGALRVSGRAASWQVDDYPEASGGPIYGSGELRRSEHREWSLSADLALSTGGRSKHRAVAALYGHDLDRESPGVVPFVPPVTESTSFLRARFGWLTTLALSRRTQWNAGVDVEYERGANESALVLPPELGGAIPGNYALTRTTPGAYTELMIERGRLLTELGLRADLPQNAAAVWSPRVGARYRLSGESSFLRGSVSRAFKLPSFFVLGSPPALGGNPDLESERSLGVDLGLEQRWPFRGLQLSAGVFYNRFENLIDFDFDLFTHVNRSRVTSRGVEVALALRPLPSLALGSNVTWQRVEDQGSGQTPLHQPAWAGGVQATWVPVRPLTLRGEGRFVSKSFDEQLVVPRIDTVAGYLVWDAAVSWTLTDRLSLRGRVDNLANASYESFIGFPEPGRSAWFGLKASIR